MTFRLAPLAPLNRLERWLFPMLWALSRQKRRLKARFLSDEAARTIHANRRAMAKALEPEALLYANLLQSCLTRLRQVHQPHADHEIASGQKKHKAQHVQFELIRSEADVLYYKVLTRRRTLRGPKNALPFGVYVADLIREETLLELSYACERVVTAKYDDPRKGVWLLVHRNEGMSGIPTMVYFNQMLSCFPADLSRGTLVLGVGEHRTIKSFDLDTYPHILIAGATGCGKSNIVNVIISSLIRLYSPQEVRLMLIDLKEMEFLFYKDVPHLAAEIITDADDALHYLRRLFRELSRRKRMFAHAEVKKFSAWNEQHPDESLPRLILIIDEFAELMQASGPDVAKETEKLVKRISNLGRAVGVHLIIATQRPVVAVVSNDIKTNMPMVIAGRVQNNHQSQVILDDGEAARLPSVPGRMIESAGPDRTIIQTPFISDEAVKESVRIAKEYPRPEGEVMPDVPRSAPAKGAEPVPVVASEAAIVPTIQPVPVAAPEEPTVRVRIVNHLPEFAAEGLRFHEGADSTIAALWCALCHWYEARLIQSRPTKREFTDWLVEQGCQRRTGTGGARMMRGVALVSVAEVAAIAPTAEVAAVAREALDFQAEPLEEAAR